MKRVILMEKFTLTLLTAQEIGRVGATDSVEPIYYLECRPTSFALATGAYNEGFYWTRSWRDSGGLFCSRNGDPATCRYEGIRPVLCPKDESFYQQLLDESTIFQSSLYHDHAPLVFYGEYPCEKVSDEEQLNLETDYKNERLSTTSKIYTFDSNVPHASGFAFAPETYLEFECLGEKYIRYKSYYSKYEGNWFRVQPIPWYIDLKNHRLISQNILVAGIQFNDLLQPDGIDFEKTRMKWYLDTHLAPNILPSHESILQQNEPLRQFVYRKSYSNRQKKENEDR